MCRLVVVLAALLTLAPEAGAQGFDQVQAEAERFLVAQRATQAADSTPSLATTVEQLRDALRSPEQIQEDQREADSLAVLDQLKTSERKKDLRQGLLYALLQDSTNVALERARALADISGSVTPELVQAIEKSKDVKETRKWLLGAVLAVLATGMLGVLAIGFTPIARVARRRWRKSKGGPESEPKEPREIEMRAQLNRRLSQIYAVTLYLATIPAIMLVAMNIEAPIALLGEALGEGDGEVFAKQMYLIGLALALGAVGGGIAISFDLSRHPQHEPEELPAFTHYFFKPLNGMFLAAVMYVALMAGQLSLYGNGKEPPTIWAVALLALITGLFSDAAMARLKAIRGSLFPGGHDPTDVDPELPAAPLAPNGAPEFAPGAPRGTV